LRAEGRRIRDGGRTSPPPPPPPPPPYAAVEQIHFEGMHYRTDIALEAIELEDL
jgi:hypothetical protein